MQIRLNEYKGRLRDAGRRIGNEDIAQATGIGISTLNNMSAGYTKEIRLDYIDALATYFAGQLGVPIDQIDLVAPEPITLPLSLNIRPDRHGKRVGESGGGKEPQPSAADALRDRQRAQLTPDEASADPDEQQVISERQRQLLEQARQFAERSKPS